MIGLIQILLVASLLLLGITPFALQRRFRRIALASIAGALAGGILIWNLVPVGWTLSFWSTLEASVNSEKYGHPIEHAAENILVMCAFACVVGGILGAGSSMIAARLKHR